MNDAMRKEIDEFLSYCLKNKKEGSVEIKSVDDASSPDGYTMNIQIGFDGCYVFFDDFSKVLEWAKRSGSLVNALEIYTT